MSATTAPLRLSPGQVSSFERDGFVNGGAVLEPSAVAELSAELDRVLELGPEHYQSQLCRPALFRDAAAEGTDPMWQIVNMWAVSEAFRSLAFNPVLTSMVAQLRASAAGSADPGRSMAPAGKRGGGGGRGDDSIVLFHDQIQYKPPNGGGATAWHQDSTLDWQRWDQAWVCTAWLPLDDVDAESGAMWMVPGAHLWGDACADPPFLTSPPVSASTSLDDVQPVVSGAAAAAVAGDGRFATRGTAAVDVLPVARPVRAGEVHFHHGLSWHHSPVNTSSRRRRALALHYCSGDTPFEAPGGHILFATLGGEQTERTMVSAGPHFPVVWREGGPAPMPAAAPPFPAGVLARM